MVKVDTDGCSGTPNHVMFVEHVQAKVSLEYSIRGDLQIYLVSPNDTRTTLLQKRKNDYQVCTSVYTIFWFVFLICISPQILDL